MSQICPELEKMHSNEFINMTSACKIRGFQRQNPLVGLLEIKSWAKKNIKHNLGRKNIIVTPLLGLEQRLSGFQEHRSQPESFSLFFFKKKILEHILLVREGEKTIAYSMR